MSGVWTEDKIDKLKKLWNSGSSATRVAWALNGEFSRSAIIGKVARLNIQRRASGERPPAERPRLASIAPKPKLRPKPEPLPRRNPTHSLAAKLAIAEAEPGLPKHLQGEAPTGEGIRFNDLTKNTCHWPKGDPLDDDFEFCGHKAVSGFPYCAHHSGLAYAAPKAPTSIPEVQHQRRARHGT